MKELNVTITMGENGEFSVSTTEGMPIFTIIGMIETAKHTVISKGSENHDIVPDLQEGNEDEESV